MRHSIYPNLDMALALKGWNHQKGAANSDLTDHKWRAIRYGELEPTAAEKARISEALGLPVEELFSVRRDTGPVLTRLEPVSGVLLQRNL
jgi:hypothetical protein